MRGFLAGIGALLCTVAMLLLTGWTTWSGEAVAAVREMPEVAAELYTADPEPLAPVDCGQCHMQHYSNLKNEGGLHRFACQECHQQFHMYSPLKDNYAELMPRCGSCHDQPHGPEQSDCAQCHEDPHAAQRAPGMAKLTAVCADCHGAAADKLRNFPSGHTEQGCSTCHHDQHGYIPDCFECHDGHTPSQGAEACAACHQDVHKPLEIALQENSDTMTCAVCHGAVYDKWAGTPSQHGAINCALCHTSHGDIPRCLDCHAAPHNPQQLKAFPNCLDCHLDVHDLPVK